MGRDSLFHGGRSESEKPIKENVWEQVSVFVIEYFEDSIRWEKKRRDYRYSLTLLAYQPYNSVNYY